MDLSNIIQARAQQEELDKELERKGHGRGPWEQAGTRLPSEDVAAFEAMAKRLNVSIAMLYRTLLLNCAQELLEKEKNRAAETQDLPSGAIPEKTAMESQNVKTEEGVYL